MKIVSLPVFAAKIIDPAGIAYFPNPIVFPDENVAVSSYIAAAADQPIVLDSVYQIAEFDPVAGRLKNTKFRKKVYSIEKKESSLQAESEEV